MGDFGKAVTGCVLHTQPGSRLSADRQVSLHGVSMRLLLRLLGLLSVVCLGVAGWVLLLPDPHAPGSRTAGVALPIEEGAVNAARHVRVVYADATTAPSAIVSPKSDALIETAVVAGATTQPHVIAQDPNTMNTAPGTQPNGQETASAAPSGAFIELNKASIEALNQIPGGGSIGRMIVAHRPYRSVDDLLRKRVVRRSVFDRIRSQVAAE